MNTEELNEIIKTAVSNLDLSNFKGDIVLHKEVKTQIGNIEPGGIGEQNNYYYGTQPTDQTYPTTDEPTEELNEEPEVIPVGEINYGTKEQHIQCFIEAMLKVQSLKDKNEKYKNLIAHTYDWVAAERLGKDIGLLNNYEELEAILTKNPKFLKVPQNTQNLTPYRSCIDSKYPFPNWQSAGSKEDKFFRRFLETAKAIYSLYTLACQREHIRPYGSQ